MWKQELKQIKFAYISPDFTAISVTVYKSQ